MTAYGIKQQKLFMGDDNLQLIIIAGIHVKIATGRSITVSFFVYLNHK
jgi:hypothetical protein